MHFTSFLYILYFFEIVILFFLNINPPSPFLRQDENCIGYYIGREHFPHTAVRIVKSIDPSDVSYCIDCEEGQPGYFITKVIC